MRPSLALVLLVIALLAAPAWPRGAQNQRGTSEAEDSPDEMVLEYLDEDRESNGAADAPRSYRRALYAYNPSTYYVDAVLLYAHRIRVDPAAFDEYYAWQVFVRTPRGLRRLTGPGL